MSNIPTAVLDILMADNPWLEGKTNAPYPIERALPTVFVPRRIVLAADHRVCLVVGPRQAGKSTVIVRHLLDQGRPFLYLNCEEPTLRNWLSSAALLAGALPEIVPANTPIFFEEIQHLKNTGLLLKGLVDRRIGPLFATGSAAFDLDDATRESLAGRALRHLLLPFSLAERSSDKVLPPAIRQRQGVQTSEEMLLFGGYPTVVQSDTPEAELTTLVESFVIKDASDRFHIRNTAAFRTILELAASQIGNLCNYSEWASVAGVSVETARAYVSLLVDSHLVKLVRPFVGGKRAEIIKTPKIFLVDNGVRNRLFGGFMELSRRADLGAIVENFVFTELLKSIHPLLDSIRFWRSKSGAEVDFVVSRSGNLEGWEVKAGNARGRVTRSTRSFIQAYGPKHFYVVNTEHHDDLTIDDTTIHFLLPSQVGQI